MKTKSYYAIAFTSKDGDVQNVVKLVIGEEDAMAFAKPLLRKHIAYMMSDEYTGADREQLLDAITSAASLEDVENAFYAAVQAIEDIDNYSCEILIDAYHEVTLHEH